MVDRIPLTGQSNPTYGGLHSFKLIELMKWLRSSTVSTLLERHEYALSVFAGWTCVEKSDGKIGRPREYFPTAGVDVYRRRSFLGVRFAAAFGC
jgi:hypothetical protein